MSAFKINENSIGLNFVKVLDETALQTYDDDENSQTMVDRAYWENKASKYTLEIADSLLGIIQVEIDSDIRLKYNKFYIGLERMGLANNFITFKPRKDHLIVQPRLEKNDETDKLLEELGLDVLEYDQRGKCYRIRLKKEDVKEHKEEITKLFIKAETNFNK